jgi:SAM-dependent methyltransferase
VAKADDAVPWDSYYRRAGRSALASRAPMDDEAYFAQGAKQLREIIVFVGAPAGGRVLEIGCGDGRMTRTLAQMYDSVIALDVAPSVLDACRANLEGRANVEGRAHVEFVLGSAEALARYPDESVDFVLSATVLQHIPDCSTVLAYIAAAGRLLRPGGTAGLQLRDPSLGTRLRDFAVDAIRLPTRLPSFQRHWRGCRLGESEARGQLEGSGLSVEWRRQSRFAWLVIRQPSASPT